jgi:membrane associated rhomboid family serine protease
MNITIVIIIITASVSILAFNNPEAFYRLKFNAWLIHHNRQYYRFFSYAFIHVDWMHLLVNMFVLYSFGSAVEKSFAYFFGLRAGHYFLLLYAGGITFSTLASYIKHRNNDVYNAVGASGAVSAVLFSSIIMNPHMSIIFLFLPVPIPAWLFGILYLVYSAYMAKKATDNIGHDAHFWGAVFGLVFTIAINPEFITLFISHFV